MRLRFNFIFVTSCYCQHRYTENNYSFHKIATIQNYCMRMEIPKAKELERKVFAINNEKEFQLIASDIFRFQFDNNSIYRDYCKAIGRTPDNVNGLEGIPFLPISFFKFHRIESTSFK